MTKPRRPPPPPDVAQRRALGVQNPSVPLRIHALDWKPTPASGRPGRPRGGVAPKGEAVNPHNVQPTICPSGTDVRFAVDPSEITPVFSALGIGRYIERGE